MQNGFLYHATSDTSLASIMHNGLQTAYYGGIHGEMDLHPPLPAIYLSARESSDNLHTSLFDRGPISVLKIDASVLLPEHCWPDDAIYSAFGEGDILGSARSVASALNIPISEARVIFTQLENAADNELPLLLKPFWQWYLNSKIGGEIAYTTDIPPSAILDSKPHPLSANKNPYNL